MNNIKRIVKAIRDHRISLKIPDKEIVKVTIYLPNKDN
jgi:hypothetical protein